jgi:predicted component of type VI protein secretion system
MKITLVAPLMLCLMLLFAGADLCNANPYGPPNAVVINIQSDGTVNPHTEKMLQSKTLRLQIMNYQPKSGAHQTSKLLTAPFHQVNE